LEPKSGIVIRIPKAKIVHWITGRSIHPKADIEAQEDFKKIPENRN
jgi:hypothetical protein